MLWEFLWGALHVYRLKIGNVENSFHVRHVLESLQPQGYSWKGYATQEVDQELKWKLRTLSVKGIEFSREWDTKYSEMK